MISPEQPSIGLGDRRAVNRALKSGNLAQGPEVAKIEAEFSADLVGGLPVLAVNSGTSGLHLGLLANGIGAGD